jgi:hypothetical protein
MSNYVSTPQEAYNAWLTPYAFEPVADGGRTLACSVASARVTLAATPQARQAVITNLGSVPAFVRFGDSSVTATASTDYTILPQTSVLLTISTQLGTTPPSINNRVPYGYIAGITATSTTTLQISTGSGQ